MTEAQERGIVKRIENALRLIDGPQSANERASCIHQALLALDACGATDGEDAFVELFGIARERYALAAFDELGRRTRRSRYPPIALGKLLAAYGKGCWRAQQEAEAERERLEGPKQHPCGCTE